MMWHDLCEIKRDCRSKSRNGGWAFDTYPELETLDAGKAMTITRIEGPAVITCIHLTQHFIYEAGELSVSEQKALGARGIMIEIYFDDVAVPAVRAPLGDFFADGCNGRAAYFSTLFVEKAPESYNCFIPMPFKKSACVILRNETAYNLNNYTFIEYEELPSWHENTGYFHASWKRFAFQLNADTDMHFFRIDGCGHLIGRSWSICTADPFFDDFSFIMEGNNEIRIDGNEKPQIDYLGTEDSFGFSWGFRNTFMGLYNGINALERQFPLMLSIYRFLGYNSIRFCKSFDLRINWSNEFRFWKTYDQFKSKINEINNNGNGWVDYATTYYWYQDKVGFEHGPLLSLEERIKPLLR